MSPNPPTSALPRIETPLASGPALFHSVRASRDLSLLAFGAAVLVAFALQAGAFLPRFTPAQAPAPAVEPSPERAPPAFVARNAPGAVEDPGVAVARLPAP